MTMDNWLQANLKQPGCETKLWQTGTYAWTSWCNTKVDAGPLDTELETGHHQALLTDRQKIDFSTRKTLLAK